MFATGLVALDRRRFAFSTAAAMGFMGCIGVVGCTGSTLSTGDTGPERLDAAESDASPGEQDAGVDALVDVPRPGDAVPNPDLAMKVVVGSGAWDPTASGQIALFTFRDGQLSETGSTSAGNNPSFAAYDPDQAILYVGDEVGGQVYSFTVQNGQATPLNDVPSIGNPVYTSLADRHLFVAHYEPGQTEVFALEADGRVGTRVGEPIATGAQSHSVFLAPNGQDVFVAAKGDDVLVQLSFDAVRGLEEVNRIATAAGAGPRHVTLSPDGRYLYLINENALTLNTYRYDAEAHTLTERQSGVLIRPPGRDGVATAADVHVHPTGQYLYASVRFLTGEGAVSVCAIEDDGTLVFVRSIRSGGEVPRSFTVDPSGQWMLVANRRSNDVAVFGLEAPAEPRLETVVPVAESPFFVSYLP